jgi:HTH-type transcriptional regulator/antitoxin HigA
MTEIRPIYTTRDYEAALAEIERLWGSHSGTPEGDRVDVLATLIDAYESEHHPIDPADPVEAIKFRMEQQSLTRKDLEGLLGARTRVAEVLNRRRKSVDQHDSPAARQARHLGRGVDPPISHRLVLRVVHTIHQAMTHHR